MQMPKVYLNTGEGFMHPLTGKYVAPLAYYEGAAHQPHENVDTETAVQDDQTGGSDDVVITDDELANLETLSHNKLKQLAKKREIAGYSTKSPEELIELLKAGE
jgi:hypothetical protein